MEDAQRAVAIVGFTKLRSQFFRFGMLLLRRSHGIQPAANLGEAHLPRGLG